MEENKTAIIIVAVVAIVAIFSLTFTGKSTTTKKLATENLVGEAINPYVEQPNCVCTLGAATLGLVSCFSPCEQCCPTLYPGSTGIPMEKYRIRLPEVGH